MTRNSCITTSPSSPDQSHDDLVMVCFDHLRLQVVSSLGGQLSHGMVREMVDARSP